MNSFRQNRKDKNKCEIHLFYSNALSFENVCATKKNIRILVIIGQNDVTPLDAISELIHLQELWIVECNITDVPSLKKNCELEKLYLYSNRLECIPNLELCLRLKILFLSENNIRDLRNLEKVPWLQELNLANNKLYRISTVFSKKCQLRNLNLAGNCLHCMKDVKNLAVLCKLNSIVFADPLYGCCPLVDLCNYRLYVINCLPHIKKLDYYSICEEERNWVNHFFKKQIMNYNILLHKHINIYLKSLKDKYEQYQRCMSSLKEEFYSMHLQEVIQNHQVYSEHENYASQNVILKNKLYNKQFAKWKEIATTQLQILQQQLTLSLNYCGNINFVEYNSNIENSIIQLCQKILEESLCSVIKNNTDVMGVKLHKVTKVTNKELDQLNTYETDDVQLNTKSMILKILVTSPVTTNIGRWLLDVFKTELLTKTEITLTDCLAVADRQSISEMTLRKKNGSNLHTYNDSQKQRVCVLVQVPVAIPPEKSDEANDDKSYIGSTNCQNESHEICQIYKLRTTNIRNPIFVIQYEYESNELANICLQEESNYCLDVPIQNNHAYKSLSNYNIGNYIDTEQDKVYSLVKICISGQNIKTIDVDLDMPNLREFNISFNRLETFPTARFMKTIQILNISFNNIESLCTIDSLHILEEFDISWNCLTNCIACFETFSSFMPNLTKLNIINNPFQDIFDYKLDKRFGRMYLPHLNCINSNPCKTYSNVQKQYFPCAFNMCKENRKQNKLTNLIQNVIKEIEESTIADNKNMDNVKRIHITEDPSSVLNVLKRSLKIQELCSTCCSLTNFNIVTPLKYLTKLNLASNFISVLDGFTQGNFPVLKYLDLTANLIRNLQPMGSFNTLKEFYCGHNNINNLSEIDNLRTWQMLRIIDLSNNPIYIGVLYKKFIIFHLPNIKYISGEYIQNTDICEARCTFGNILDTHMLNALYKTNRLINITQLSLVNCSLTKVQLSADVLPHLESLDLSKNRINCVYGLHTFNCLHTICLSYNLLEKFNEDSWENNSVFPNLSTLFLDHNCIKSLMNIITSTLPKMQCLFLNHNHLQNILEMNKCPILEILVLDYNEIELLKEQDFVENNKIKFLSLENNKINTLAFISSLENLERFYIANNSITDKNELLHLSLLKNLEELTLEGNPLTLETTQDATIITDFELKTTEM